MALQFVVVMAMILPIVAPTATARELAQHFNQLGQMPTRLLVFGGRIGSLVFYLDPTLRAKLTDDRLQQLSSEEEPPLRPGDAIAVPQWRVRKLRKYFDVDHNPYESIGPYRLYHLPTREAALGGTP
jgi:hypothetical protein